MPAARDPEFYLRHADYVRALARQVVFDRYLAEDVEQRVWLAALENAPSDVKSPRAWLKALVRSFAIKVWRSEARRVQREEHVSRSRQPVPTPAEILEHESARKQLVEALLELEEPYRSTLTLRFFEGLELREVAARLGLPLETVRTHYKRGLARLRERLERRQAELGAGLAFALVRALRLEPPSYAAVGGAALRTLFQGAVFVSAIHTAAIAAAAIVLCTTAFWAWRQTEVATPKPVSATGEIAELPPVADGAERIESSPSQRAETAAAIEATLAPTPAANSSYGSLLLRVVWPFDKTPAPGVWLRLLQEHADDYYHDTLEVQTGADGTLLIERILAGNIHVRFDRGGAVDFDVPAGRRTERTLEMPAGYDAAGVVLDVDGRPFAGAAIYVQVWGANYEGFVVAHSREDGAFEVRALRKGSMGALSALAPNRAPTKQTLLLGALHPTRNLRLQFELAGGAVAGRVLGANGEPLANASVLVGSDSSAPQITHPDGTLGRTPISRRARTNAIGQFELTGVASGTQPIQIRARGFASWRGELDVVERSTVRFEARLNASATLAGIVRAPSGEPASGVEIWVDTGNSFTAAMCRTDSDGAFAMRDLPLGAFEIEADGGELGRAEASLFGSAGAALRWDPTLSPGLVLLGRVELANESFHGWSVSAETAGATERWDARVEIDGGGRFAIANCPDEPLRVKLHAPLGGFWPVAVVEDVRAGAGELVLVPDPALAASVRLVGRIVDADAKPLLGAMFIPCNPNFPVQPLLIADPKTGRFSVGPCPPGEWSIRVISGGLCSQSPMRALVAGETHDFGDVRAEAGAMLVVELGGDCGADDATTSVWLRDASGWSERVQPENGIARFQLLPAGRHRVTVEREGCAKLEREIEVRSGEELRVQVALGAQ